MNTRNFDIKAVKRLRTAYIAVMSMIAVLTLASQFVMHTVMARNEHDAPRINIAGMQRMLSQRISKTALMATFAIEQRDAESLNAAHAELTAAFDRWNKNHAALVNGSDEFGTAAEPVHSADHQTLVDEKNIAFRQMHTHAVSVLKFTDPDQVDWNASFSEQNGVSLQQLLESANTFLPLMNSTVKLYETQSNQRLDQMGRLEIMMAIGILIVIGLSALFIFEPTVRLVSRLFVKSREAEMAKDEFLANMSHEIRTPLTAIMGYNDILHEKALERKADPQELELLRTMNRAGEHLLLVIGDILDISKIEAGKLTVDNEDVPIGSILNDVDSLMRVQAGQKSLQICFTLNTPIPHIIPGDATRIRQILLNLIGNAIKFTEQGGISIDISTNKAGDTGMLDIRITDTGSGMSPEQASNLFKPFSQADASISRQHGGTGLGLTIGKKLAELMGGDVTLDWTEAGKGSCFRLALPFDPTKNHEQLHQLNRFESTAEEINAQDINLDLNILVAEDGPDNQRLIKHYLTKAGARVTITNDGQEALDVILRSTEPFDLVVTDIQMPIMDGHTLAQRLRELEYTLPIIALTAHARAKDRQLALAAGCNDHTTKPINRLELLKKCYAWTHQEASKFQQTVA